MQIPCMNYQLCILEVNGLEACLPCFLIWLDTIVNEYATVVDSESFFIIKQCT